MEKIQFENAYTRLLVHLATRFINHPVDQMDAAINEALHQIAEFLGGMRAAISQVNEAQGKYTTLYEWHPLDDQRLIGQRQPIPDYDTIYARLVKGEVIKISRRDELPAASELHQYMTRLSMESAAIVPIWQKEAFYGFISMSWNHPRDIQPEIIDLLRLMGEIFLNALDRKNNENRIQHLNDELEDRIRERTQDLVAINDQLQAEIHERQQAVEALRTSEERYQRVTGLISDYAFLYNVEPDNSITVAWFAGDSYTQLTGYTVGEAYPPYGLYHPDDRDLARSDVARVIQGETFQREYRIITKTGELRWILVRRYPVWDAEAGRVVRFYGVAQNITERKQAEAALVQERNLLQTLINNLPDHMYVKDRQSRFVVANQAVADFLGVPSPADVIGKTDFDFFEPEEAQSYFEPEQALMDAGEAIRSADMVHYTAAGKDIWAITTKAPWRDGKGEVVGLVGINRDLTERKSMEEALRESQQRLELAAEAGKLGIWDWNLLTNTTYHSPMWAEMLGFTLDEVNQMPSAFEDLAHPDEFPVTAQRWQDHMEQRTSIYQNEIRMRTKAGTWKWILTFGRVVERDAAGKPLRAIGVHLDISERKQIEEALWESRQRLELAVEAAHLGIWDWNFQARKGYYSPMWAEMLGYSLDEINHMHIPFNELAHPGDLALTEQYWQDHLEQKTTLYQDELRLRTKAGGWKWILTFGRVVERDATGKPIRGIGVHLDIDARKRMEEAVRESEERYRIITELISDFAFVYRPYAEENSGLEWITKGPYNKLTGYDAGERQDAFHIYHPDDEPLARADVELTLQGETTAREYRILTRSGETRWLYMCRYPVWDEQHQRVDRFYGVAQDITERKRIEAEEHEQRILATALLDTASALNSTLDLESVLDRILANIERVTPHDAGVVMLLDGGVAHVVRVKGGRSPEWRLRVESISFPLANTTNLRQIYATGQPLIIPDTRNYPDWISLPDSEWICSNFCIPLKQGEEVIGFLSCESSIPEFFTPKMMTRLQAFAHQTAIAITNARLYQQAQELAVMQERQRLARDLHDAVTQTLFSANVMAEALLEQLGANAEHIRPTLTQLGYLTHGALAEMRSLLLELRPEALEGMTLTRLTTQLADSFRGQTGILPTLNITGERTLPPDVKITLYRITQEALNNISKHARASKLEINLNLDSVVKLVICDNGRGFALQQVKPGSLGLKIMRERADKIGAQFNLESEPNKGTTLTVEWMG